MMEEIVASTSLPVDRQTVISIPTLVEVEVIIFTIILKLKMVFIVLGGKGQENYREYLKIKL